VKNVNPTTTQQYAEKANCFLRGMKRLNDDDANYSSSVGLLAVHSAISLSDAINVGLTGKRGKFQDHTQAVRELDKLCASHKISNTQGVDHFKWLLGQKNAVAYEHRRFDETSVRLAIEKAERFNAWAYNHFKEILRGV
jgi:hypothetical protein